MQRRVTKALERAQNFTRTDMRYLAKGGFWSTLSYIIQISAGFITTVALANLLSKGDVGTYQFVLSLASVVSVLTLSGLDTTITRAVAQGREGAFRSGVRTKAKWNIGIIVSAGAIALYYLLQSNSELAIAFLLVAICAPIIECCKLYLTYLFGKEAFRDTVTLGAWRKPLPTIAVITAAFITQDALWVIATYFISNALSVVWVYILVLKKYRPPIQRDEESVRQGKHLSLFRMLSVGATHADKVLVWHFLGPVAIASYSIAQLASKYSGGFFNTVSTITLPKLSKRDLPTLQKTLPRKVFLFMGLMTIFALLYALAAPLLFALVFPEYPESIFMTQLLAITFLFMPRTILAKTFVAHNLVRYQYAINLSVPVLRLMLLTIGIGTFGIWGAIGATIIADALHTLLLYICFKIARVQQPIPLA